MTPLERFGRHTSQCRANLAGKDEADCNCGLRAALAAEPERGLDAGRLQKAMQAHRVDAGTRTGPHIFSTDIACAEAIAAEYARLSREETGPHE